MGDEDAEKPAESTEPPAAEPEAPENERSPAPPAEEAPPHPPAEDTSPPPQEEAPTAEAPAPPPEEAPPPSEQKGESVEPKAGVSQTKSIGKSRERVAMADSVTLVDKAETSAALLKEESSGGAIGKSDSSNMALKKKRSSLKGITEERKSRTERLGSRAQRAIGSSISIHRLSATGDLYDRSKAARYANTYKLFADNPFNQEKVYKILELTMTEALENLTYDSDKCPKQAKWASSAIRARVKDLDFDRYKLVCLVTIGEKNSQDVLVTCRFLWDTERDRYATFAIENTYVFGVAQCFGIYYE